MSVYITGWNIMSKCRDISVRQHPESEHWAPCHIQTPIWLKEVERDVKPKSNNFAGMHWFYWKFAEGYIIVKFRSSSILVIICKILAKLWPFFDLVFVVGLKYKVKILFPLNNFWRDALISFKVCSKGLPLGIGAIKRTSVFFFLFHIKWLTLKQSTHPILGTLVYHIIYNCQYSFPRKSKEGHLTADKVHLYIGKQAHAD